MEARHTKLLEGKEDIKIIQITDTHLFKNKDGILKGAVNSFEKLQSVINDIKQKQQNFDAIVVTGDISEDRSKESYQYLKEELDKLGKPSLWLPGNHDNFENMPKNIFNEHVFNTADIGKWKLIFLDTTIKGVDHGNLSPNELNKLNLFLKENADSNKLICMHHPPINVGSEFIDVLGLENKDEFWKVLSEHPAPQGIIFGHVHQVINENVNGIFLSSPPSTCLQWVPFSRKFSCSTEHQGYQEIILQRSGKIQTRTEVI